MTPREWWTRTGDFDLGLGVIIGVAVLVVGVGCAMAYATVKHLTSPECRADTNPGPTAADQPRADAQVAKEAPHAHTAAGSIRK